MRFLQTLLFESLRFLVELTSALLRLLIRHRAVVLPMLAGAVIAGCFLSWVAARLEPLAPVPADYGWLGPAGTLAGAGMGLYLARMVTRFLSR